MLAAADGRVVYAGSGLRGYGNLVIVKHNATYLTAYAHNQTLLVKEDQVVRRGQQIAEMGSSDADRVQLHFEIRAPGQADRPGAPVAAALSGELRHGAARMPRRSTPGATAPPPPATAVPPSQIALPEEPDGANAGRRPGRRAPRLGCGRAPTAATRCRATCARSAARRC